MLQEVGSVRQELELNRERVANEILAMERITAASDAIVAILAAAPDAPEVTVPDTLAWLVGSWAPSLEMSFDAIDALVASGRLAQEEDPGLRLGLAGLRDRFDDVREDQLVSRQLHLEQEIPLLSARLDLERFVRMDAAFFGGGSVYAKPVPGSGTMDDPNSLQLRNLIRLRASWYVSGLGEARSLLDHIDGLLASME